MNGTIMSWRFIMPMLAFLTGCSSNHDSAMSLAARLADEGGADLSEEYRKGYILCGRKALSNVPSKHINAALKAPNVSAIWKILGDDTLDRYVRTCREVDLKRGPPSKP